MLKLLAVLCLVAVAYCDDGPDTGASPPPPADDGPDTGASPPSPEDDDAGSGGAQVMDSAEANAMIMASGSSSDRSSNTDTVVVIPDPDDIPDPDIQYEIPSKIIWVPQVGLQSIDDHPQCDKASLYNTKETTLEIDTEQEYVCAFISYQFNYDRTYVSQSEANDRYVLFKSCVDLVNSINSGQRSWTAEVNNFCDWTDEEKGHSRGLLMPDDEPAEQDNEVNGLPSSE